MLSLKNKIQKIIFFTFLVNISYSGIFAAPAKEEPLVNRKVLILDFINVNSSADYSYLESSIPESLLDPLTKTKSFELLLRTTWARYVTEQRFNKEDAFKEDVAIEAGRLAGADVVVIGQFVAQTDHIQIFAKALEMSSGRIIVSESTAAPLDNDLFNAIDRLAEKMATEMKGKLPPLAQKVIIEQRIKYVDSSARSPKAMIRQAQTEAKAQRWRDMERSQADRWRMMEQEQAMKWRMREASTVGWKETEAIIANGYWSQPLFMRLFGNIIIGTLTAGSMGFVSGMGMTTYLDWGSNFDLMVVAVSGGSGALLGLATGILVTIYDNNHLNESILGTKLLVSSTLWYGFGALAGSGIGIGIGYIIHQQFHFPSFLDGMTIGSLTGLVTGVVLAVLPTFNIIPKEPVKNVSLDIDPVNPRIAIATRF